MQKIAHISYLSTPPNYWGRVTYRGRATEDTVFVVKKDTLSEQAEIRSLNQARGLKKARPIESKKQKVFLLEVQAPYSKTKRDQAS